MNLFEKWEDFLNKHYAFSHIKYLSILLYNKIVLLIDFTLSNNYIVKPIYLERACDKLNKVLDEFI